MSEKEDFFDQLERFTVACKKLHANVERAKAATSEQDAIAQARAEGRQEGISFMRGYACGAASRISTNFKGDEPIKKAMDLLVEDLLAYGALPLEPGGAGHE